MWRIDPLAWRVAVIVAVPAVIVSWYAAVHEVVPDRAADLHYEVHINRLTGDACLRFPDRDTPTGLRDLAC